jgi:hypothetical protein
MNQEQNWRRGKLERRGGRENDKKQRADNSQQATGKRGKRAEKARGVAIGPR